MNYVTALGSIGPVGTLLFLMYDGIKNREVTVARDSRQEEMWTFQKYQMHRKLFEDSKQRLFVAHAEKLTESIVPLSPDK